MLLERFNKYLQSLCKYRFSYSIVQCLDLDTQCVSEHRSRYRSLLLVPTVTVVMGGGKDTIESMWQDLRKNIPVIIVDASESTILVDTQLIYFTTIRVVIVFLSFSSNGTSIPEPRIEQQASSKM